MNKKILALIICLIIGVATILPTKVFADSTDGWIKTNTGWRYFERNNMKTGWLRYNGNLYYLNNLGYMATGWSNIYNIWYYMNNSGEVKTGWLLDNGKWYYFDENGALATNITINGYHFRADGVWVPNFNNTAQNRNYTVEHNSEDFTIRTDKSVYKHGIKGFEVYITNNTNQIYNYGEEFSIEKLENNKWTKVPFKKNITFNKTAINLDSNKTNCESISLLHFGKLLTEGKYRIVKEFNYLPVTAEFELK